MIIIYTENPEHCSRSTLNLIHKWRWVFEWKCISNWDAVKARIQSEEKKINKSHWQKRRMNVPDREILKETRNMFQSSEWRHIYINNGQWTISLLYFPIVRWINILTSKDPRLNMLLSACYPHSQQSRQRRSMSLFNVKDIRLNQSSHLEFGVWTLITCTSSKRAFNRRK